MAVDKLVDSAQLDGYFTNIASAIRSKAGASSTYTPSEMPQAIEDIPSGGGGDEVIDNVLMGNITSINTSVPYINSYVFYNQSLLTTVEAPEASIVSNAAFNGCTNLTTISFPLATAVFSMGFSGCKKLSNVYMPNLVSVNSYAFQSCSLSVVNFPSLTTASENAFAYNSYLTDVSLPHLFYVSTRTFRNCPALVNVSLPMMSTCGSEAFYSCTNLPSISLPNITSINANAFTNCKSLMSIYLLGTFVRLMSSTAFNSTPIVSSVNGVYGSIFVKASLYSSYIASTMWNRFSSRIVSVTE